VPSATSAELPAYLSRQIGIEITIVYLELFGLYNLDTIVPLSSDCRFDCFHNAFDMAMNSATLHRGGGGTAR
jgi:hypothetical protein